VSYYALCAGVNDYPGEEEDLYGCVNDVHDWVNLLDSFGYLIRPLVGVQFSRDLWLEELRDLVKRTTRSDVACITLSCHGTWVIDEDGDESDGRDEAICPHDYKEAGVITDDEISSIIDTCPGLVILITDCCHSGSVSRAIRPADSPVLQPRFRSPESILSPASFVRGSQAPLRRPKRRALHFAGCRDIEYCYDTEFNGRPNGAFTRIAIDSLKLLPPGAANRDWFSMIKKQLPSADYPQTPQITATRAQLLRPALR
jgi:metacaspase-1